MTIVIGQACDHCEEWLEIVKGKLVFIECPTGCGGHIDTSNSTRNCCRDCTQCIECDKWVKHDAPPESWCDICHTCAECCECRRG